MNYTKLPDTPWHIGYVKKDDNDPRRHKSRCVYNEGRKCTNPYMTECVGSAHCRFYAENEQQANRIELMLRDRYRRGAGIIPSNKKLRSENKSQPVPEVIINQKRKISKADEKVYCRFCNFIKSLDYSHKVAFLRKLYQKLNPSQSFQDFFECYNTSLNKHPLDKSDKFIKRLYSFFRNNQNKFNNFAKKKVPKIELVSKVTGHVPLWTCPKCKSFSCVKNDTKRVLEHKRICKISENYYTNTIADLVKNKFVNNE